MRLIFRGLIYLGCESAEQSKQTHCLNPSILAWLPDRATLRKNQREKKKTHNAAG